MALKLEKAAQARLTGRIAIDVQGRITPA